MFSNEEMQMVLAFVIVGIIGIVIWYKYFRPNDKKRRREYSNLIQQSSGGYDKEAGDAMEIIKSMEKNVAEDSYIHGNILEMNVLQGDLRNAREDKELANTVIHNYNDTLTQIANNRRAEPDEQTPLPGTNFMIDHVADFLVRQGDLFQDNPDDNFWQPVIPEIMNLTQGVEVLRENIKERNKTKATENAANKKEYAKNYAKLTKSHTSDSQNVHDSSVIKDYKQTLAKLPEGKAAPKEAIEAAKKYIESNRKTIGDTKCDGALHVLSSMSAKRMDTYGMSEPEIFQRVWDRSNCIENKNNSDKIKLSIVDGLYNCIRPSSTGGISLVCSVGRASNYMGALATLDADPSLGTALTLEQYKNEILNQCVNIIDKEVTNAKNSNDKKMQDVANSYDNPLLQVDEETELQFKGILKNKIDSLVDSYSGRMSKAHLDNIRNDCYISATID